MFFCCCCFFASDVSIYFHLLDLFTLSLTHSLTHLHIIPFVALYRYKFKYLIEKEEEEEENEANNDDDDYDDDDDDEENKCLHLISKWGNVEMRKT